MTCHTACRFGFVALGCSTLVTLAVCGQPETEPNAMKVDLESPQAAAQWVFSAETVAIRGGELVLDGRQEMCRAFFTPWQFTDVALEAKFLVEPGEAGVLACGFIVRVPDASSYYYVHFDRAQAILVRADVNQTWNEIKRVGGLDKPAGHVLRRVEGPRRNLDRLQADGLPRPLPRLSPYGRQHHPPGSPRAVASLHYSLDECQTWSDNVLVDTVGGAYPSMVNLKDGTVLIVYYEEGAGSSIRAKRLRATRSGIEWLPVE